MRTSTEIFAENLRTKLIERNKKQVDLAKYLGTTKATVTHWVNGENMPRMDTIDKICVFLRCEADDLLKDHSKPVEYAPEDIIAEQINENPQKYKNQLKRLNNIYLLGNISETEYKRKSADLQQKIASLSKETPKKEAFTKGWKDVYKMLDAKHRKAFWQNLIREIHINEDLEVTEVLY